MNEQDTQNQIAILTPAQIKRIVKQVIWEAKNLPQEPKEEELLTSKEIQKLLNIGNSTMHRYINEGKLKPIRYGRKLLFKKSEVLK
jgi:excisionase family DNA binding protein